MSKCESMVCQELVLVLAHLFAAESDLVLDYKWGLSLGIQGLMRAVILDMA